MKYIIIIPALLLLITSTSHPHGGVWSKISSLGEVVSTGGGDTVMINYFAVTAAGQVYTSTIFGESWNLCVNLPSGVLVKGAAPSYENSCILFVYTYDKSIYKVNVCNCTYTVELPFPIAMQQIGDAVWKNTTTCWATGDGGTIFYTTDSGQHWMGQNPGFNEYLSDIEFISGDTDRVVVIGNNGKFAKSKDNGNTWQQVMLGTTEFLSKFSVLNYNPLQGLISGSNGKLFVIDDYLSNKSEIPTNTELGFNNYTNIPPQLGSIPWGVSVLDNGKYAFLNKSSSDSPPTYTIGNLQTIPGASQEYLLGVTAGVRKSVSEYGEDSLIILVTAASGALYRYSEAIASTGGADESETPRSTTLGQNYPNPFNPMTRIRYEIARGGEVSLRVYDVLGNEVRVLINERQEAGSYEVDFDSGGLASGCYFYRLSSGDFSDTRKMIIIK